MSKYAAVNVKFGADISQFSTAIQNATRQMQKAGEQLQAVGASMTRNLTAPIVALGAAALYSYGQIDALKRGLITFAGSAEAAEVEFNKLREVAKLPGIGLEEAVRGSNNLQAIGMSADDARVAMMAFGNAIATVGGGRENFELAIRGFGQLRNAAKPLQQDLYQIANQLPQVNKLMIDAFGTNRAEELAAMGITGKQLAEFLVNELGKLPPVAGGIKNAFENMGDTIKVSLAKVGEAIEKNFNISKKISGLAQMIGDLSNSFTKLSPTVQKTILSIVALVAILGPLILAIGTIVKLFPTFIAGWSVLKGAVIAARTALVATSTVMVGMPALFLGIVGAIGLAIISMNNLGKSASEATQKLKEQREEARLLALERDKLENPEKYFKDSKKADIDFSLYGSPQIEGGYKGFQMGKGQEFEKGTKFKFAGDINIAKKETAKTTTTTKEKDSKATEAEMEAANALYRKYGEDNTAILNNLRKTTQKEYNELEQVHAVGWEKSTMAMDEGARGFANYFNKYGESFQQVISQISLMMESFIENTIADFAAAIGEALVNDENPFDNWGKNLLNALGGFMQQMGALFIGWGINLALFKDSLKTMNPYLAIAAGVALVGIGAAISATSRKGLEGASSGSSGYSTRSAGGEDLTLTTRLDGRDLVLSGQRTTAIGRR